VDSPPPLRSGCSMGPAAIRKMAAEILKNYRDSPSGRVFDLETGKTCRLRDNRVGIDLGDMNGIYLLSEQNMETVRDAIAAIVEKRAVPVVLGGDARIAQPLLERIPDQGGVLLFTDKLTLPRLFDEAPTDIFSLTPKGARLLIVGLNGYQDRVLMEKAAAADCTIITAEEIYSAGVESIGAQIRAFTEKLQKVVCIVNAEVLDTGFAAGTPMTNVGGMNPEQLMGITEKMDVGSKLSALCVAGVAPELDKRRHTEYLAAQAAIHILKEYLLEEESH
jgi:arginase family enzyme